MTIYLPHVFHDSQHAPRHVYVRPHAPEDEGPEDEQQK
jgi:hypothetical protein